jgi:hypothetical protein
MTPEEKIIRDIEALLLRLKSVNDRLAVRLQPKDLRLAAIGLPGNVLHSYLLHFAMASYTITLKTWWSEAYRKSEPSLADLEAMRNLEAMTKHATFVFFLSRIEWTFRKLITFLYPGACAHGGAPLKSVYDHLFRNLGLQKYVPLYDLCRHLRNSVHSNGIFISRTGTDESVIWRGTTYRLRHMQPIDFVTHDLTFQLYADLIDSLEDILAAPAVIAPAFIEDRVH